MAVSTQSMSLTSSLKVVRDTDSDATAEANINSGAATIHLISVDNTANAAQKVYLKLYNATGPTVGTTVPDMIIPCPGGTTVTVAIPSGIAFGTGVSFATVTAGGTGGTTNPTSDVSVILVIS